MVVGLILMMLYNVSETCKLDGERSTLLMISNFAEPKDEGRGERQAESSMHTFTIDACNYCKHGLIDALHLAAIETIKD